METQINSINENHFDFHFETDAIITTYFVFGPLDVQVTLRNCKAK